MLSNTFKMLLLTMAVMFVSARPEVEFPEAMVQTDETDNLEMDELLTKKAALSDKSNIPAPLPVKPAFLPRCPFDCGKVCVVKIQHVWGNPPIANFFYICHKEIHECCLNACQSYQKCVLLGQPEWACYANALDDICKCRSIIQKLPPFKG